MEKLDADDVLWERVIDRMVFADVLFGNGFVKYGFSFLRSCSFLNFLFRFDVLLPSWYPPLFFP